jgi:outer membrane protein assembly factor BamB
MKVRLLLAGGLLALAVSVSQSADWPQFRGPDGTGVIDDPKLPAEWDAKKNVAWKAPIPGVAWSCPIVVGDRVFVTTAVTDKQQKPKGGGFGGGFGPTGGGKGGFGKSGPGGFPGGMKKGPDAVYAWRVLCLDRATGKVLWDRTASEGKPRSSIHGSNTYATETPVSDGQSVYAYFGNTGLYCYDLAGKQLWKKDLGAYGTMFGHGTGSSPVFHGGKLFVQCDNEEKSFLVALDAKTGDDVWKVSRPDKTAWCTPFVWKTRGRTDLVVGGSEKVRGYDPATGKVVWELSVPGGYCESSPVGDAERLYFGLTPGPGGGGGGGGFGRPPGGGGGQPGGMRFGGGGLYAIKAGATGDISLRGNATSNAGVAWSVKTGTSAPSPLVYQGYLYVLSQTGGMITCYDAKTGKVEYNRERIPQAKSFWASPWAANGKIFCLDEDGVTHVLKAGPEFDVLDKNALPRETYWATPAAADGALFVRGVDTLYCIK